MKKKNLLMTAIAIFGLATITFGQTVPSYIPTTGLVGWWPFNGNANDESINGNNGVVNGPILTTDRFGNSNKAYSFDGVNDNINPLQNNLPFGTTARTISIWFQRIGTGGNLFSYGSANTSNAYMISIGANIISNQGWADDFPVYPSIDNSWHNLVCTFDGLNSTIYLDNSNLGSNSMTSWNTIAGSFYFGTRVLNDMDFFNGNIDDIAIWNRQLTPTEITAVYNGCSVIVTTQPINQSVNISNNAQFTTASSDPLATYQWQTDLGVGFQNLNSVGQYSGTTNDTLSVSNVTMTNNNQPFRCIVSSGSCTDTSAVAVLTVVNNTGINEVSPSNLFSVYPNPANGQINVMADAKLLGSVYNVYDKVGKVVLFGKINSENTVIDLGNLSGGIYLFSIGDNLKQTFKVIKE
jgi:hypothetical protein